MATECIAYRRNSGICANGFIQTHFCWFGAWKCSECGRDSETLPHCLKDELPDHWVKDDGSPAFYRPL
jgi:hypothetical protein